MADALIRLRAEIAGKSAMLNTNNSGNNNNLIQTQLQQLSWLLTSLNPSGVSHMTQILAPTTTTVQRSTVNNASSRTQAGAKASQIKRKAVPASSSSSSGRMIAPTGKTVERTTKHSNKDTQHYNDTFGHSTSSETGSKAGSQLYHNAVAHFPFRDAKRGAIPEILGATETSSSMSSTGAPPPPSRGRELSRPPGYEDQQDENEKDAVGKPISKFRKARRGRSQEELTYERDMYILTAARANELAGLARARDGNSKKSNNSKSGGEQMDASAPTVMSFEVKLADNQRKVHLNKSADRNLQEGRQEQQKPSSTPPGTTTTTTIATIPLRSNIPFPEKANKEFFAPLHARSREPTAREIFTLQQQQKQHNAVDDSSFVAAEEFDRSILQEEEAQQQQQQQMQENQSSAAGRKTKDDGTPSMGEDESSFVAAEEFERQEEEEEKLHLSSSNTDASFEAAEDFDRSEAAAAAAVSSSRTARKQRANQFTTAAAAANAANDVSIVTGGIEYQNILQVPEVDDDEEDATAAILLDVDGSFEEQRYKLQAAQQQKQNVSLSHDKVLSAVGGKGGVQWNPKSASSMTKSFVVPPPSLPVTSTSITNTSARSSPGSKAVAAKTRVSPNSPSGSSASPASASKHSSSSSSSSTAQKKLVSMGAIEANLTFGEEGHPTTLFSKAGGGGGGTLTQRYPKWWNQANQYAGTHTHSAGALRIDPDAGMMRREREARDVALESRLAQEKAKERVHEFNAQKGRSSMTTMTHGSIGTATLTSDANRTSTSIYSNAQQPPQPPLQQQQQNSHRFHTTFSNARVSVRSTAPFAFHNKNSTSSSLQMSTKATQQQVNSADTNSASSFSSSHHPAFWPQGLRPDNPEADVIRDTPEQREYAAQAKYLRTGFFTGEMNDEYDGEIISVPVADYKKNMNGDMDIVERRGSSSNNNNTTTKLEIPLSDTLIPIGGGPPRYVQHIQSKIGDLVRARRKAVKLGVYVQPSSSSFSSSSSSDGPSSQQQQQQTTTALISTTLVDTDPVREEIFIPEWVSSSSTNDVAAAGKPSSRNNATTGGNMKPKAIGWTVVTDAKIEASIAAELAAGLVGAYKVNVDLPLVDVKLRVTKDHIAHIARAEPIFETVVVAATAATTTTTTTDGAEDNEDESKNNTFVGVEKQEQQLETDAEVATSSASMPSEERGEGVEEQEGVQETPPTTTTTTTTAISSSSVDASDHMPAESIEQVATEVQKSDADNSFPVVAAAVPEEGEEVVAEQEQERRDEEIHVVENEQEKREEEIPVVVTINDEKEDDSLVAFEENILQTIANMDAAIITATESSENNAHEVVIVKKEEEQEEADATVPAIIPPVVVAEIISETETTTPSSPPHLQHEQIAPSIVVETMVSAVEPTYAEGNADIVTTEAVEQVGAVVEAGDTGTTTTTSSDSSDAVATVSSISNVKEVVVEAGGAASIDNEKAGAEVDEDGGEPGEGAVNAGSSKSAQKNKQKKQRKKGGK